MVIFKRYPHVQDLIECYLTKLQRQDIKLLLSNGLRDESDAEIFANFIWDVVEAVNEDEESGIEVMGSTDNTDMLPDLSYEVTKLMKDSGFYQVWKQKSSEHM